MVTSVVTTSGNTTCMDFSTNQWHGYVGGNTPYGLWVDGPLHPWRDAKGTPTFITGHSEGYRYNVLSDWHNGHTWTNWNAGRHWNSPRDTVEGHYANRHWIVSPFARGSLVVGLTHHEFYQSSTTIGGVKGFNSHAHGFNTRWVNGIGYVRSTNDGQAWTVPNPGDFGQNHHNVRCVLIPEPWSYQSIDTAYGFLHPSNIVQEGNYYYAFIKVRNLPGNTTLLDNGFTIIRTSNLDASVGWQFYNNANQWETVINGCIHAGLTDDTGRAAYAAEARAIRNFRSKLKFLTEQARADGKGASAATSRIISARPTTPTTAVVLMTPSASIP